MSGAGRELSPHGDHNHSHNIDTSSNLNHFLSSENHATTNTNHFIDENGDFINHNWSSSMLMDPHNDILYDMNFGSPPIQGATPTNNIVHSIQYQNHVTPEDIDQKSESIPTNASHQSSHSFNMGTSGLLPHPTDDTSVKYGAQADGNGSGNGNGSSNSSNNNNNTANNTTNNATNNNDINTDNTSGFQHHATNNDIHPQHHLLMNHSNPAISKNSKTRRPCDHCRRRKTKCVIIPGASNCVQCEAKSLSCTYVGQAVKRKPVGSEIPANKKTRLSSTVSEHDPMIESPPSAPVTNKPRIVAPNVPIRDVAPVQDYSSMNNSLLKKTLSLQFPRSSFYVGPTSYIYDVNLLNLIIDSQNRATTQTPGPPSSTSSQGGNSSGRIEQVNLSDFISLRKVSNDVQFVLRDDQSPESYQSMSNDVDTIEKFVAPHGQILIDLYFRIVHPSYPILHKKVFLEKYSRTHREFSAPLLAAVYVLAIQWWDYDPLLNRFPKPNVELILKIGLNNYLLEILKRPKLSAVQAGLLLLQCKHIVRVGNNNNNEGPNDLNHGNPNSSSQKVSDLDYSDWVLCSQVIALAEELGLGLDCTSWKLPKWERGLRKRLAWAVYMEDKWLSLKNSRPSHINEMNWIVISLAEEDFPEKHGDGDLKEGSSDIDNGKRIFMCLIDLSMILSEILAKFYSMRAMISLEDDVGEILKLAKPIQLKLRNWYHTLPVELQMSSVQPRKLCSNGYLQLAYFATELTLHRKIITAIYHQIIADKPPPQELISVCRSAANTRLMASIEFVRDLKPEHIHSFWHSSSASNFTLIGTFAGLLFASAQSQEESNFYRDQIFNYRWILKISSKGFDQVGDALLQLDLVLNHIPGLLNDNSDIPMVVPTVRDTPPQQEPQQPQQQKPQKPQPQQPSLPTPEFPMPQGNASIMSNPSPGSYNQRPQKQMQQQQQQQKSNRPSMSKSRNSDQALYRGPTVASPFEPSPNATSVPYRQQPQTSNTNGQNSQYVTSPHSQHSVSSKEGTVYARSMSNANSVDYNSPNSNKSKPNSPTVNKSSPLSNQNFE